MDFTPEIRNRLKGKTDEYIDNLAKTILKDLTSHQRTLPEIYKEFNDAEEEIKFRIALLLKLKYIFETPDGEYYTIEGGEQYLKEDKDDSFSLF